MMTHYKQRADAIIIGQGVMRRQHVPTIWGQPSGNTIHLQTMEQFRKAGGIMHFNADQTEIVLTLPEGHKFGCRFGQVDEAGNLLNPPDAEAA